MNTSAMTAILELLDADALNRTALYRACRYGRTDAVRLLLLCPDLDINSTSDEVLLPEGDDGYRDMVAPIDICCWRGHTATLRLLIEARADIGPCDAPGSQSSTNNSAFRRRVKPMNAVALRRLIVQGSRHNG